MLGAATVIVDDRHRVLLVKHAYGERNWELPGGRGEARESVEVTEIGWFSGDTLPRPVSDFTIRRIDDAFAERTPAVTVIGPRVWLR